MKNVLVSIRDVRLASGHVTFDDLANGQAGLSIGNVISPVQHSFYIRSFDEVVCNGKTFEPGQLRSSDLRRFSSMPTRLMKKVEDCTLSQGAILYQFRHPNGSNSYFVHGYILTSTNYNFIWDCVISNTKKSEAVVRAVRPYVAVCDVNSESWCEMFTSVIREDRLSLVI